MKTKNIFLTAALIAASFTTFAQVGVGTTDPKAGLDITSDKGMLLPRMADHTTLTPVDGTLDANEAGLQVYNNTTNKVMLWNGAAWVENTTGTAKFVDGTTPTDAVFTGGNVGIGTTSPSSVLEMKKAIGNVELKISTSSTANEGVISFANTSTRSQIRGGSASGGGGDITFMTQSLGGTPIDRMIIDNSGNVGIGTTSTTSRLSLVNDGAISWSNVGYSESVYTNSSQHPFLSMKKTTGSEASPGYLTDNKSFGAVIGRSLIGESSMYFSTDGDHVSGSAPTKITFHTTSVFSTLPGVRMTIKNNGFVGIGKTSPGSRLAVVGLPTYADNTAALAANLTAGDFYRTADGTVKVVF
jgi:hypothetical protein